MSIWIPTSYKSIKMLFLHSNLLPSSNSRILTLGVKSSKISKFCPLVKTVIELQNYISLVNTSLGICSVSKIKPRITSYKIFMKIETSNLPRKIWFLTEAPFKILMSPLRSWLWNESVGGLVFWFRVPVGPARKTRQQSNWQFTNCLEKHDFE